jgi:peptidoglycan/xylan/chitin deacetylase (PgdA/CDA1 family)
MVRAAAVVLCLTALTACAEETPASRAGAPSDLPAVDPVRCTSELHAPALDGVPDAMVPVTFFQPGHGWWGSGERARFDLDDVGDRCLGGQSARMTSGGTGRNTRIGQTGLGPVDFTDRDVAVWVKVDDWAHLDVLRLWLSSDPGDFRNAVTFDLTTRTDDALRYALPGRWVRFVVPWGHGTPEPGADVDRARIRTIQLQVFDDNTGHPVTVRWNGIAAVSRSHNPFPRGVVSLTFDDGYATQDTQARAYLDLRRMRATLYALRDYAEAGEGYHLTTARLRDLERRSGWEIGAHAAASTRHDRPRGYAGLSAAVLEEELAGVQSWLADHGLHGGEQFAYPKGYFDPTVLDVVRARTGSGRVLLNTPVETWPPSDRHRLRAYMLTRSTPVSAVTALVDQAVVDRAWLILVFHQIQSPAPAYGTTPRDFQEIVDHIADSGVEVLPVGEVLAHPPA